MKTLPRILLQSIPCLETTVLCLSWKTNGMHLWQKDLYVNITEPVTRDHLSRETTFLCPMGGGLSRQILLYSKVGTCTYLGVWPWFRQQFALPDLSGPSWLAPLSPRYSLWQTHKGTSCSIPVLTLPPTVLHLFYNLSFKATWSLIIRPHTLNPKCNLVYYSTLILRPPAMQDHNFMVSWVVLK